MSVEQLESALKSLPPEDRLKFIRWVDDHRHQLVDVAEDIELSEDQKSELLRRKGAFLNNPEIAQPWEGTASKILDHLHARRAQKTSGGRS
jgi:hypothetical protein